MLDQRIIAALTRLVGPDGVVSAEDELRVYECDGATLEKRAPQVVVLPNKAAELPAVVELLHREGVAFVPRGAGTGLSGGCLPVGAPVVICTSRLNRILEVDFGNRRAVVEPGVVNLWVTRAVEAEGLFYAPDPSSQPACTIGGNVAENSAGAHTLKYGATTNHVLGLDLVLPNGELVQLGGAVEDAPGYDLVGLTVGSEGTFGIVTRVVLRLLRKPESWRTILAVFESVADACNAVSAIIAAGMVPAALEIMDRVIIDAVEAAYHFGFPADAGAVLIVELDGPAAGLDEEAQEAAEICRANQARELKVARDEAERAALWQSRKRAFGAMGRLSPNYSTQDGVVPRTKLPEMLGTIATIAQRYRLRIGNVFHAGDGNVHPLLLYDERDADQVKRVLEAGREILEACVALGGTVSGEHGIGCEKIAQMPLLFAAHDLCVMQQLRAAFDPDGRCNPGKIFPTDGVQGSGVRVQASGVRSQESGVRSQESGVRSQEVEGRENTPAERVAECFREGLGRDSVASGDAVWRYSCAGMAPHCVVTPRSVDEVCDAVRLAAANRFAVVPCGHGTHLYIGSPPRQYDAALSVRRLNRIVAYDASDLTVTVQAGATLQGLNAWLAEAGQWLPVDPSYGDSITVGGLLAADRNGPLRLAYGKVRDLLLGVKVVTADGEVLSGGGKVVKNVAGYDLPKLFVGSFGTLGVIVEASFRVWPRPPQQRLFVWPAASVTEAVERGLILLQAGVAPMLVEALNANAGETIGVGSAALVIGCAGRAMEVRAQEKKLGELLPGLQVVDDREAEALCKALAAFPQPINEDALVARASVLPTALGRLLKRFEGEAESRGVTLEVAAHAGNGVAWCQLAGPFSPLDFELCAEAMRVHTRASQGWLVFEALPAGLQGRFDPWGFNAAALLLMRRVKHALDPAGIFAPGRFVGGI